MASSTFSEQEISAETIRLARSGMRTLCGEEDLHSIASETLELNALKAEKKAVLAVHVYQRPELLLGVADYVGDSYKLAKDCASSSADVIVFCGVRFMAETAKILNPGKTVILPAPDAGCTLSDSITAADVRKLKAAHPGLPVITYINTTAEVKAESDCIVTSANAEKILRRMLDRHGRVIFTPDKYMGANMASRLGLSVGKEIILWNGSCVVHEKFDVSAIENYRRMWPGVKVLAHAECPPELADAVDFLGGTSDMMKFVEATPAPAYMLVTECGLGELARVRFPDKNFVSMCRLCPYMKMTTLGGVISALRNPSPAQVVEVDPSVAARAKKAIDMMFELAEG